MLFKFLDFTIRPVLFFARYLNSRNSIYLRKAPSKLAVIKLSALGDVLCLIPSVITFKKHAPSVRISLVTTFRSSPDFIDRLDVFDEIIVLNTSFLSFFPSFFRTIFSISSSDVVIDCDQSYQLSELITLFCPFSIGFFTSIKGSTFNLSVPYSPSTNERYSFYLLFLKLSSSSGLGLPPDPLLHLDSLNNSSICSDTYSRIPSLKKFLRKSRPLILLYPGSSLNAIYRRWPIACFKTLYSLLSSKYDVCFVGGPSEVSLIPYLSSFVPESKLYISKLSLYELSIFISNSVDLLIGNDSSLIHLSDLLRVPTFGLFGPNSCSKWGPLAENSQSFSLFYPCSPCMHPYINTIPTRCYYPTDSGQAPCMLELDPHLIVSAVNNLLD